MISVFCVFRSVSNSFSNNWVMSGNSRKDGQKITTLWPKRKRFSYDILNAKRSARLPLGNFLLGSKKKNFSYSAQVVSIIFYLLWVLSVLKFSNRLEFTRFDILVVSVSCNRFGMLKAGVMLKQFFFSRFWSIASFPIPHTMGNKGRLFSFCGEMCVVKAVHSVFTFRVFWPQYLS